VEFFLWTSQRQVTCDLAAAARWLIPGHCKQDASSIYNHHLRWCLASENNLTVTRDQHPH